VRTPDPKNLKETYCFELPHQYKCSVLSQEQPSQNPIYCSSNLIFADVLNHSYIHTTYFPQKIKILHFVKYKATGEIWR
jgi:hypothetical protein